MKFQPRLILTSLCVLLYQVELTPAEEVPKPRFGYGSATQAAPRPAPKAAGKATLVKDGTKPASAKKATGKPSVAVAKTSAKPAPTKSPRPRTNPETAKKDSKKSPAPEPGKKAREIAVNPVKFKAKTKAKTGSAKPVDTTAEGSQAHQVDIVAAQHSLTGNRPRIPQAPETRQKSPIIPPPPAPVDLDPRSIVSDAALAPAGEATVSLDDPAALDSSLSSLQLPSSSITSNDTLSPSVESTLAAEPALPTPVRTASAAPLLTEKASPDPITPDSVTESPLELPGLSGEAAPPLPEEKSASSVEADLSERERAFVRTLVETAGSVDTASSQLNTDLPPSIATSATMVEHPPEGSTATFPSAAEEFNKDATAIVPELRMESSHALMPATPGKMPDALPAFIAPASGKIDITSDRQADYDQVNNKVIFTGKVELNSATLRLRAERVEVFMKTGGSSMERVEASGHVLMRTQDTAHGPGQMASAGRAIYHLKSGEIVLADWPKIQETGKSHISTDPSTKMVLFTDGRLRTDGPNRTIISGGN